ncbi:MAG: iron transporter permease [Panacagrimonas sp.]|jgi:iron complex transport system permease protein|nr:iron chelate uptake ABC transporter family permease subunit [Panacagrimonas sp.]MCC2657339.1 iron transporter permease [Panacagrimonas sp.]
MSEYGSAAARRNAIAVYLALGSLAIGAGLLGLSSGAIDLSFRELLVAVGLQGTSDATAQAVVIDLRLPRIALAFLVGATLACSGTAMQGLFRNPLADPGLVGVSSGAALAAVAMIVSAPHLHLPASWMPFATPLASFAGGLAAALLAGRLAASDGYTRSATLLLAGLAINSIAGAGIGLLTQIAGDSALREAMFWLFGSLSKSGWDELAVAAPILIGTLLLIPRDARALNALLLGESEAMHLGVNVERLKRRLILLIVLSVAACVALTGVIGFVGLVVPHLLRLLLGPDHVRLLPASALGGAALLALADWAARTIVAPAELPIGILTALIGGPFFLLLLIQMRGRVETWT